MPLSGKWFITPAGSVELTGKEHTQLAIHYLLNLPIDRHVPMAWTFRGIPEAELEAALKNGADLNAVEFLSKKGNDARLYVLKHFGWVRTFKSDFNVFEFDDRTAKIIRGAHDYWKAQKSLDKNTYIDFTELKDGKHFSVPAWSVLEGGDPQVLKNLALGYTELAEEKVVPEYLAARYTGVERDRLYRRTGGNPQKRRML